MPRSHICESCAGPAPRPVRARAGAPLSPPFVVPRLRRQRRRHGTAERGSHAPHRPLVTQMAVVVVGLPPEEGFHVAAAGEREAREEEQRDPYRRWAELHHPSPDWNPRGSTDLCQMGRASSSSSEAASPSRGPRGAAGAGRAACGAGAGAGGGGRPVEGGAPVRRSKEISLGRGAANGR